MKTIIKTYLNIQEILGLEDSVTNKRDKLLILILASLGCRVSEALSIGVEDIDFISVTVRI